MSECAVLDSTNDDGFQSFDDFEEFEAWSTYTPMHWNESHGDSINDWRSFDENLNQDVQSTPLFTEEGAPAGQDSKVGNGVATCLVFHDCIRAEETVKDLPISEIPSMSELLYNVERHPQTSLLSREAVSLFQRLLCDPQSLSLSGPKPCLYSHKRLIETLQLQHSDELTCQCTDSVQKRESPPTTLIQTKLTGPRQLSNSPGFLYQVSQQWLSQCSMRLMPHQTKKKLLQ